MANPKADAFVEASSRLTKVPTYLPKAMPDRKTVIRSISEITMLARASGKPMAVILAGHNGSGKSTLWYDHIADELQVPLINADRMMLSILPTAGEDGHLRVWAKRLRDSDQKWMATAQKGVHSFVAQAMTQKVPFAVETVFSHWKRKPDGTHESKIDLIKDLQGTGYFVLLLFVGLANASLSLGRVAMRKAEGGHGVAVQKLLRRFSRTQHAVRHAVPIADAVILVDNSGSASRPFTPCFVSAGPEILYDLRRNGHIPAEMVRWLNIVAPITDWPHPDNLTLKPPPPHRAPSGPPPFASIPALPPPLNA